MSRFGSLLAASGVGAFAATQAQQTGYSGLVKSWLPNLDGVLPQQGILASNTPEVGRW